jgi:hypothetical protein
MSGLLRLTLLLAILLGLAAALPSSAAAQQRPRAPARLIGAIGDCLTVELGNALKEPAYSEELPEGWRVVVMLKGQLGAASSGLQSPPPEEDQVTAVDIYQILPNEPVPDFVDNMSAFLMVNERDNRRYVVEISGYFWLRVRSAANVCIEHTTGGLFTFQAV